MMYICPMIQASSLDFLKKLKKNNNREWFNDHKTAYQQELALMETFAGALLKQLNAHDEIETPSGKKSLFRIYRDTRFSSDKTPYKKILKSKTFVSMFQTLKGDQVKTAPKGYDSSHEAIDLLRHKQFLLIRHFSDKEVLSKNFLKEAGLTFKAMRPFFDYMSEVLTTDSNGLDG